MNVKVPTLGQVTAFGRHVITYSMGAATGIIGALAFFHVVDQQTAQTDAATATAAITQISTGVKSIIAGTTSLVALCSGLWAAISASPLRQLIAVSKNPEVKQVVVASPATADAVPSDKVVAK